VKARKWPDWRHAGFLAAVVDIDRLRRTVFGILLVVSALGALFIALGSESCFYPPEHAAPVQAAAAVWVALHLPLYLLARSGRPLTAYTIYVYMAFGVLSLFFQTARVDWFIQLNMEIAQVYCLLFVGMILLPFERFLGFSSSVCGVIAGWAIVMHDRFVPPNGAPATAAVLINVSGMWALSIVGAGLLSLFYERMVAARDELAGLNARLNEEVSAQATMITGQRERMFQSQKLEAIGHLAGGVAHDFNNKLTVIAGYGDLLLNRLGEDATARRWIEAIRSSTGDAARLTRQLLSFGRREMIRPRVVSLNTAIAERTEMLSHLLGEHTSLRTDLASGLRNCVIDLSQLEQVLVNLVMNARDAMPGGGRVEIATRETVFSDGDPRLPPDVPAGRYVTLTVRDSGDGMSRSTLSHLFEPFFTTKERGEGTGLGLATVYGVVKRHGGHIEVESALGAGAVFSIHFPATESRTAAAEPRGAAAVPLHRGGGTVLVVEDEARLRNLISEALTEAGYTVRSAGSPAEAGRAAQEGGTPIDLLISDVVMPGGGGRQAVDEVTRFAPGIKVLYVSGYADDVVAHQGVLDEREHFLQKPFSPSALLRKVQEILA